MLSAMEYIKERFQKIVQDGTLADMLRCQVKTTLEQVLSSKDKKNLNEVEITDRIR